MPARKGNGPPGFARTWVGPGKPAFVNRYHRYAADILPPQESAYANTPIPTSFNSLAGADGTSAAVPVASGTTGAGDIVIVGSYKESSAVITPPANFFSRQIVLCSGSHIHQQEIFWHRPTAPMAGTMSFSWTGTTWSEWWTMRITGAIATGDPFDPTFNFATTNSVGSDNVTPPVASLLPSVDNCLIGFSGSNWIGSAWTPPAGFTERVDISGTMILATRAQATAETTGIVTAQSVTADVGRTGALFAILPVLELEGWGVQL